MTKLADYGHGVSIWRSDAGEYFVYGCYESGDPRVVPSLDMARSVAMKALP